MKKICFGIQKLLLLLVVVVALAGCKKEKNGDLAYVTISANPEVELVVNENNVVVAVNGVNEDGKLLLEGEDFVGLKVDVVTGKIVDLTEELGFVFKGEVKVDSQEIEISVSSNASEVAKKIETQVKSKVESKISELQLALKVEIEESKSLEDLKEIVEKFDPTLTEEEIDELSYQEVLEKVKQATLEKAQFATVKLEEYYQSLKEQEFKLAYKEEIAQSLEKAQQSIAAAYQEGLSNVREIIDQVKEFEVYTFTNPESEYLKTIASYQEAKKILASKKVELSVSTGASSLSLEIEVKLLEEAFRQTDALLEKVTEAVEKSFDLLIEKLEQAYDVLEEFEKELTKEIDFKEKLSKVEKEFNANKDEMFKKFEESISKENLEKIEKDLKDRKEALRQMVKESKNK